MVKKVDGPVGPPKVRSQWVDWLLHFMDESPGGGVEDYLRWCRGRFRRSGYRMRLAKRVEANPHFKRMIAVHRSCLGVDSEVVRSMSGKQLLESDIFQLREEPWYPQVLLDDCKRFSLSAAWRDFVESHVLFNEGSAGLALLQTPLVDYTTSRGTGLVIIAFAIDVCTDVKEILQATSWVVSEGQRYLYGAAGSKLRPLDFCEFDARHLFHELVESHGKTYNEIIEMTKRSRRTGRIHPAIREVYPDKTDEEIAKFLRGLTSYDLSYEGVHSAVRHTRDRFKRHYRAPNILAGEF